MSKKKILTIVGISLGFIGIGFVTVKIISRWNKEIIEDWRGTILVSKDDYSDAESIGWDEEELPLEERGEQQEWIDPNELSAISDEDIQQYLDEYDFLDNV